jgi:hypothetical protein
MFNMIANLGVMAGVGPDMVNLQSIASGTNEQSTKRLLALIASSMNLQYLPRALAKEMEARHITDPWELTEYDQWVNDAPRKDIEDIVKQNPNVFGMKIWNWTKIRGQALVGAFNFSVDYIFKDTDEPKVDKIIKQYNKDSHGQWNREATLKAIDALGHLSLLRCTWV